MRMPAIASLVSLPFAVGFLLLDSPTLAIACFVPFYTVSNLYVGPLWSTTQNLARPDMRATASAVQLFILNIVGLGFGPFMVGALNDALAGRFGDEAIRYSLLVAALLGGLATFFFWLASATLREDLASRDELLET
jgi:predicted MFS family arabinose efflux permease